MNATTSFPLLEQLVTPLGECLTPEAARRIIALRPNPGWQARIDDFATRHTSGQLSAEERAEYSQCVSFATFMALLKSKARQLLAASERD